MITTMGWVMLGWMLCGLTVIAAFGLAVDHLRRARSRLPGLLTADASHARAMLTFYTDVND